MINCGELSFQNVITSGSFAQSLLYICDVDRSDRCSVDMIFNSQSYVQLIKPHNYIKPSLFLYTVEPRY